MQVSFERIIEPGTHASVAHTYCVTSCEWGPIFFVFPYPPFQFLKLVVIAWWVVAGILSVKRIIWLAVSNPEEKRTKVNLISQLWFYTRKLMSVRLTADVACLLNVL